MVPRIKMIVMEKYNTEVLRPIETTSIDRKLRLVFATNNETGETILHPWEQITVLVHEGLKRYYYDVRGIDYEKSGTPSFPYRAYSSAKNIDMEKAARFIAFHPNWTDWEE